MFESKWTQIAKNINFLNTQFEKQKVKELDLKKELSDLNNLCDWFSKKLNQLSSYCEEKFQERLNSLATTHGIKCLSCGEKDLNYPPLTKYTYGDDEKIYIFENNDV